MLNAPAVWIPSKPLTGDEDEDDDDDNDDDDRVVGDGSGGDINRVDGNGGDILDTFVWPLSKYVRPLHLSAHGSCDVMRFNEQNGFLA